VLLATPRRHELPPDERLQSGGKRLPGIDCNVETGLHEDNEQTIEELRARIRKTVAFAEGVKEAQYVGASERKVKPGRPAGSSTARLLAANDDPQHLFPHRDGLRHPPPQ
jgi:hypothetical protein